MPWDPGGLSPNDLFYLELGGLTLTTHLGLMLTEHTWRNPWRFVEQVFVQFRFMGFITHRPLANKREESELILIC